MNKLKIGLIVGVLAIASVAAAQTLSPEDFAVRQQMIDFAKYFPDLVSQYYSGYVSQNEPNLGSVSASEIVQNNFAFGGKRLWAFSQRIPSTLASTSCSILAPQATSTVLSASYGVTAISSTSLMAIGWSSGPQATTTLLSPLSVQMLAGNPQPVHASSTVSMLVIPPSIKDSVSGNLTGSFINFKIGGGAAQTAAPTGSCSVIFIED